MLFSWSIFIVILSCSVKCWSFSVLTNYTQAGFLHRTIRQAKNCKPSERLCNSGECILKQFFCDGEVNCSDGSDETISNCANVECPDFAFHCAYGACVSGDAKCDKNKDCADNSDETLPECNNGPLVALSKCGRSEVACNDQTCISKYSVCDGIVDCPDRSDETFAKCNNLQCAKQHFKCSYGACVDGDAPCNGVEECADGSDEATSLCATVETPNPSGDKQTGCKLPPLPANGYYLRKGQSDFVPGEVVPPFTYLEFFCHKNYKLDGIPDISCGQNSKWNRALPECLQTCTARQSSTLDIKCTRKGLEVDCTQPVLHGTIADVACKQFYYFPATTNRGISPPYNHLVCEDGSWDNILVTCIPVCGKKTAKGIPNIIGGGNAKIGEYPWHVGIYVAVNIQMLNIVKYTQVCGGSIINTKVIISAAHCFENRDPSNYKVAAGKYYRAWNDSRDPLAQPRNVEKLYIPEIYKGQQHNYANDIAVIIVNKPFEFSDIVSPVCVDWTSEVDKNLLVQNMNGYVAGWGLEQELGENSIELKHLQLTFVPYDTCFNKSDVDFRPIIGLPDKFCAGREDGQNVCSGDSGGGLSFQRDGLFYLMGIVSIGPDKAGSCDASKYTTFTKFAFHAKWADNITRFNLVT